MPRLRRKKKNPDSITARMDANPHFLKIEKEAAIQAALDRVEQIYLHRPVYRGIFFFSEPWRKR